MTEKLKEFEYSSCRMFRKMVEVIKKKFIKYYSKLPLVFTCSAALNPCLNIGGVETLIRTILENLDMHLSSDPEFVEKEIKRFETNFEQLFGIYCEKYGQQSNPIVDQMREGTSRGSRDININLYNALLQDATKRQRTSAPTSELGIYKATNFLTNLSMEEFNSFDILAWWKDRETQYPILAAMARDLLAVQASTVASESAFSVSGRIINERRSRLTPQSVEVCVCLKDYLDGVARIQNNTTLEGSLDGGIEETIGNEEEASGSGTSPPTTELDEGEFEDFEIESVDEDEFWDDLDDQE